jgi:signal transduction histidine kinase/CheY-like chemotaxis protein
MKWNETALRKGLRAMACRHLKIAALLILPLGLLRAADGPGASTLDLTSQEQAWLQQHPQIRVGLDPAWPPFSFYNRNHELAGMDIDMLQLLQQRLGISFIPSSGRNWSEVYAEAKSGGVDMLGGVALTPERVKDLNFTESYIEFPVGIITRDDGPFMIGFPQLMGHRVAAPRDYAPTLMLQRTYPGLDLILTENVADALRLVSRRQAFATLDNLASANYIIKDNGLSNLKVAGITNEEFELRYGVRKDWPELIGILHKALASISDQERETLKSKWINLDVDDMLASRRYEGILLTCLWVVGAATLIVLAWNWTLAREVSRRKKAELELKEASNKAVDANRMKSAFLANLSHEIRNPLNALLGFTELLKVEASDVKFKKYVDGIDAGGRTLLGIINDVLDLSKVEAGRIDIRPVPVNLRLIFDETQALFAPRAAQKGLGFSLEIDPGLPPLLLLDELRLRQILYNAVSNAVKFTAGGFVRLTVACLPDGETEKEKTLTIEVIDTGAGIPPEDHQRIFEPFAQRLGQSPHLGGTGLGLAISKKLTELMGGRLELESVPNRGSTFRFIFPHVGVAPPPTLLPAVRKGDLSDFKPLTVLVVDDLESNRELLKEYFQCAGHVVLEAADAEQGIVCARANPPDLVLLDFRMPGMNGREAALVLKTDPRTACIPVIFISGSIHLETENPSIPGAILLAKPLIYAELVAALRQIMPDALKPA